MERRTFIGRNDELSKLHAAFDEASQGKGKLLLIEGSAGVGKSGLVREFINRIESNSSSICAISECNDKENLNAYAPFKDILMDLNAQTDTLKSKLSKDEKLKKLKQFVSEAGTGWIGLIPVVGGLASSGIETYKAYRNTYQKSPGEEIQTENDIYRIFETEFRRLAQKNVVIVFIDDLQWADASSLNLLFALGKSIRANPYKILLIGSYRLDEIKAGRNKISETGETLIIRHPFADKLNELRNYLKKEAHITENENWFHEITIQPFKSQELQELINSYFPNNQFNPDVFDQIHNLTDGHALYLVEVLDYLERNRIIFKENGTYKAREIKFEELPVSVNAIINEKVERLNDELRKVLSYASVNGEQFTVKVIERILKMDELDLLDYLEELSQKHGLLVAGNPMQIKDMLFELYSFSQTMVHKFIYGNMDGARRRALHRRIAETIKDLYGDAVETNKEIKNKYNLHLQIGQGLIDGINMQLSKSADKQEEEIPPQIHVIIDAAKSEIENARDSYEQFAMDECYNHVDKALAFLSQVNEDQQELRLQKFEALHWRNKAWQWQGHYQKALQAANAMKEIALQLNTREHLARAYLAISRASTNLGDSELIFPLLKQCIDIYSSLPDKTALWEAYTQMGYSKYEAAAFDEANQYIEKALRIAEELGDENKKAENLLDTGSNYSKKSEYDTAISYFNLALTLFEKNDNQYQIGQVYNKIGLAFQNKGMYAEANAYLEKALDIAQKQNDQVNMSNRLNNIALIYNLKGNYEKAIEFYTKTLNIDQLLDNKPMIAQSMNNLGSAYVEMFDFDKAMEFFNQSLVISESLNDKVGLSKTYSAIGHAWYPMGETDKAIEYIQKALDIDIRTGNKSSEASNYIGLGNAYKTAGQQDMAKEYYLKGAEVYKQAGDQFSLSLINNNLGGVALANGDFEQAIEHYEQALAYALEVGDQLSQSMVIGNIADCFCQSGQNEKGIEHYQKAIALAESLGEKGHLARHLNGMALSLFNAARYEEAIPFFNKATGVNEALGKKDSLGANYRDLGDTWQELNELDKAIASYSKAIKVFEELYGEEHELVAQCYLYTGDCYFLQNKDEQAVANHEKALEIQLGRLEEDHEDLAKYFNSLGMDYFWMEKYDPAIKNLKKAYEIRKAHLGEHNLTDFSRFMLAKAFFLLDLDEEASLYLNESLQYRAKVLGEGSEDYNEVLELIESMNPGKPVGKAAPDSGKKKEMDSEKIMAEIDLYFNKGIQAFDDGNYKAAIQHHKIALKLQFKVFDKKAEQVATSYFRIALAHYFADEFDQAIEIWNKALGIYIHNFGELYDPVAMCYEFIGSSYYYQERYELSISLHLKAINIYSSLVEDATEKIAECQKQLGLAYYGNDDVDQAIATWKSSWHNFIKTQGNESEEAQKVKEMIDKASGELS